MMCYQKYIQVSVVLAIFFSSLSSVAQPGWVDVFDSKDRMSFKIPRIHEEVDTLDIRMYAAQKDSITIEVHAVDTKKYIGSHVHTLGPLTSATDTLAVCIDMLLHVTQGTLKSQRTVTHDGRVGKETEIVYQDYGQSLIMVNRFYWFNNRLITFTVTGKSTRSGTISSYKTIVFNSILFY